ncbi:MAG: DUF4062 domain-containing protein [Candidatus Omnitrophica bacterium]|nr:DUF4062 domain-containing protein [Candidatus Omnitrophota bacterium]
MNRPKIFISSTIYDFQDLRSSLKFWLEEFGYQVQLSEFNDFEKNLEKNSYEACLDSIKKSQYFILFIGSRVGGFYNQKDKISITQKEYRQAYQCAKDNDLNLIIFVRKNLWDVKEDREELCKLLTSEYIKEKELTEDTCKNITSYRSKIVNDAEFLFSFVDEACRKKEMKDAINNGIAFPKKNWVHTFSSFNDIIDVLKNELPLSKRLSSLAYLFNIKMEVANNLKNFFSKEDGRIRFGTEWAEFAINELSGDVCGNSEITEKYLRWLCIFEIFFCRKGENLSTQFIDDALMSGEFLDYNTKTKGYAASDFHKALFNLRSEINKLRKTCVTDVFLEQMREFSTKYQKCDGDNKINVPNIELVTLSAIYNAQLNILMLSRYVLAYINKKNVMKFSDIKLQPVTSFRAESDKIKEEDVSTEEILAFF